MGRVSAVALPTQHWLEAVETREILKLTVDTSFHSFFYTTFLSGKLGRAQYYRHYDKKNIDAVKLMEILIASIDSEEPEYQREQHIFSELIKLLQSDNSINIEGMLKIEWNYLEKLDAWDDGTASKTLETHLGSNPDFFAEIVKMRCYVETSKILPCSFEKARTLLYRWDMPPGLNSENVFIYDDFSKWMLRVEEIFVGFEHLEVVFYEIGKVLFYVPSDEDGFWINREIATMLNEKKYTDVRDGLFNEAYNSRGVRGIDVSGQADKDIANMYRERADITEKEGFRLLAESLKNIASSYNYDARRIVERYSHKQDGDIL